MISEERKELKPCAHCDKPGTFMTNEDEVYCGNLSCTISGVWMTVAQWNLRPAEKRLEARVKELETAIREGGMKIYYEKIRAALEGR